MSPAPTRPRSPSAFGVGLLNAVQAHILQARHHNIGVGLGREQHKRMLALVEHLRGEFARGNAASLGEVMHEAWLIKRDLADRSSSANPAIERARSRLGGLGRGRDGADSGTQGGET